MEPIYSNIFYSSSSEMSRNDYELKLSAFLILFLSVFLITSCAPKVSFQIKRPPIQQVEKINYIEIGDFRIVSGQIPLPSIVESEFSDIFSGTEKLLNPTIGNFNSKKEQEHITADLLRAALVHELSLQSPYQLINTTGKKTGFSGILPDETEIAVLHGNIKYEEIIFESQEGLSYFTTVKNKGATLEQSLLASAFSMGAESSGSGFVIATPYVEQIAALAVEFSLFRKKDGSKVIPSQIFRTYFARKWGGSAVSSHLPLKIKNSIIKEYQSDENYSESLGSKIDRAGSSFDYFERGFKLRENVEVPQTALDLKIRLARQIARQYVKQISPYHETTELLVQDGNSVAVNLIRGNAYQEAVAFLLALNERTAADEYNLGLAFEAGGEIAQARKYYETALVMDEKNTVFKDALKRTEN